MGFRGLSEVGMDPDGVGGMPMGLEGSRWGFGGPNGVGGIPVGFRGLRLGWILMGLGGS